MLRVIPPGLILLAIFAVVTAAVFYAALPYKRRSFAAILGLTALGFALGQGWDFVGLPALRLGQANVLPGLLFALGLQLLVRFMPRPSAGPQEPPASNSTTGT